MRASDFHTRARKRGRRQEIDEEIRLWAFEHPAASVRHDAQVAFMDTDHLTGPARTQAVLAQTSARARLFELWKTRKEQ
jgi:hypothetical protein